MLTKIVYFTLFEVLVHGEQLQIKNNDKNDLLVSVTGLKDLTVPSQEIVSVEVPDDFSGSITGVPNNLGKINIPRTRVELTLSPMGDAYDISLIEGFNIKAKVTPLHGRRCKSVSCTVDINALCSLRNQVRDITETVTACHSSLFLFKAVCPGAVVTSADVRNVLTCSTDSYLITLG